MINALEVLQHFATKGHIAYDGEGITQLEHAWQCGQLALQADATPELQLAAWLHDLGHLMTDLTGSPTLLGIDDRHEDLGWQALLPLWGPDVAEPVRLHVQAKRFMVATYANYARTLSPDSVRSLALQGGPMSPEECKAFEANPYYLPALQLRAWDDLGKRKAWFATSEDEALGDLQALMEQVSAKTFAYMV